MKKIIIIQWDMQIGPIPIVQHPPEAEFPNKEILLKIWANHEMGSESNFIVLENTTPKYCSLIYRFENKTYFLIIELHLNEDGYIFHEIIETIAQDLIKNINNPRFPHILSDSYRTIKSSTEVDEQQSFLRLFNDKIRIAILNILHNGCISKFKLRNELLNKYGYSNINLELFLAPFLRLGMIQIVLIPGCDESINLVKDVYGCRIPPKNPPGNEEIRHLIANYFETPRILSVEEIIQMQPLFEDVRVRKFIQRLESKGTEGISYEESAKILEKDLHIFKILEDDFFICKDREDKVYLTSKLMFYTIKPKYLIPFLVNKFQSKDISMNQLISQMELIQNEQ